MQVIRMSGYRPSVRDARVKRHARRHVKRDVEPIPEIVVTKLLGPEVMLDDNPEYQRLVIASKDDPRVAEYERELQETEREFTRHLSPMLLALGVAGLSAAEFVGLLDLVAQQGIGNPTRTIVAAAGVAVLFFLAHRLGQDNGGSKRRLPFYLTIAGLAVFVFGIAVLRHEQATTAEDSLLSSIATTAFLTAISLGPSVVAREFLAKRAPAAALAKNAHRLRHQIKQAIRVQSQARAACHQCELRRAWYLQEKAQITSVYVLEYRECGGKLPSQAPPVLPPPPAAAVQEPLSPLTGVVYNPYQKSENGKDRS